MSRGLYLCKHRLRWLECGCARDKWSTTLHRGLQQGGVQMYYGFSILIPFQRNLERAQRFAPSHQVFGARFITTCCSERCHYTATVPASIVCLVLKLTLALSIPSFHQSHAAQASIPRPRSQFTPYGLLSLHKLEDGQDVVPDSPYQILGGNFLELFLPSPEHFLADMSISLQKWRLFHRPQNAGSELDVESLS